MQHQAITPETIATLTVREFGDVAATAGVTPSELLAGLWLRLAASELGD